MVDSGRFLSTTCSTADFGGAVEVQGESETRGPTLRERIVTPQFLFPSYPISSKSSGLLEITSSFIALVLEALS